MVMVNIHEAKTHLSSLVAQVEDRREHIIICRYGRAVAELVPVDKGARTVLDKSICNIKIKCDLTAPTEEEWDHA